MQFEYRSRLPVSAQTAFDWHVRPGAFERLAPPWARVDVVERSSGGARASGEDHARRAVSNGARVKLRLRLAGRMLPAIEWLLEHVDLVEGRQFCDAQIRGPFKSWRHTHRFEPIDSHACELIDHIEYELPGGAVGAALGREMIRRDLTRLFRYRHELTKADLFMHEQVQDEPRRTIAITGSTGFIGSALAALLTTGGHRVRPMVRRDAHSPDEIPWDPTGAGVKEPERLRGVEVVIHLAGESIGDGRWTERKMKAIRDSRVIGTRALCESLASLPADQRPRALISGSAIGYYGDRGAETLTEASPAGNGFLADVCQEWEAATTPARDAGMRVVLLRTSVVLEPSGGALAKMLTPFRMGVGGVIGSGEQWMSWISLDDAIGAIHHAMMKESIAGPVNLAAPRAVTNREFTKALGGVLRRPTILPMPAFAARAAFGKMADEALLASQKVSPVVLRQTGYQFRDPELEPALRRMFGR